MLVADPELFLNEREGYLQTIRDAMQSSSERHAY